MVKPIRPRDKSQTWLPFLRNHIQQSWAIDFCTVASISFRVYYIFVVFEHGRRKVLHFNITQFPSMEWVIQQLREAMPFSIQPRYLFRDNDGIYGNGVSIFLKNCGMKEVRTAYHSPWQNPFIERFFGTLRRELLNHVIPCNERHLHRLITEFVVEYYHTERPHQGLEGDTPIPFPSQDSSASSNRLISSPILGGLHHKYRRAA